MIYAVAKGIQKFYGIFVPRPACSPVAKVSAWRQRIQKLDLEVHAPYPFGL